MSDKTLKQKQQRQDKEKQAYAFYVAQGWTPEQSIGIIGNIKRESGFNPNAIGDAGKAFGLAQWHPDRQAKAKSLYGNNWKSFENQLKFIDWELKNTEKVAGDKLKKTKGVWQAGQVVSDFYERPKVKFSGDETRQTYVADLAMKFKGVKLTPEDMPYFDASYANSVAPYMNQPQETITPTLNYFNIPKEITTFASVPDSAEDKKETVEDGVTSKDVAEVEQKTKEYNFLEELQKEDYSHLQPEQVAQQQIVPQVDFNQQYEQVSQFIDEPLVVQQGGSVKQDNEWLKNWYTNRVIPNKDVQGAYLEDKPIYTERLKNIPLVTKVNMIDNNPQKTGQYQGDTGKILMTPTAQPSVYTHEVNHYLNDFPSTMRTVHENVVEQNMYKKGDSRLGGNNEYYDYLRNPDEIHSRVQVLRKDAGFKPNEEVTQDKLLKYLQNYKGSDENILQLMNLTDEKGLLEMLNYMAETPKNKEKQYVAQQGLTWQEKLANRPRKPTVAEIIAEGDARKVQQRIQTDNIPNTKRDLSLMLAEYNNVKKDEQELRTTGQIKNPNSIQYRKNVKTQPDIKQDNVSTEQRNAPLNPLQRPLIYLANPEKVLGDLGVPNMETSELDRQAINRNRFNPYQSGTDRFLNNAKIGLGYVPEATVNTALAAAFMPEGSGVLGLANEALNPLAGIRGNNSKIDWSKWNKEIPENAKLIAEYNTIEQTSKANGTWMKNMDGTAFKGSPEQFVQQNSENFKKSYPDEYGITYRGQKEASDVINGGTRGYNSSVFTGDLEQAKTYANNWKEPIYKKEITGSNNIEGTSLNELLYPKSTNDNILRINAEGANWDKINNSEVYNNLPAYERDFRLQENNPNITTDDISKYMEDRGFDRAEISNVIDNGGGISKKSIGKDKSSTTLIHNNNEGRYLKSRVGNNGMFDMNNPNIYKSVVPIAGASYLATQGQNKQQGGKQNYTENELAFLSEIQGIPVSSRGMYDYPNQEVIVPTNGSITMKGIPHKIKAKSLETGEEKILKPNREYYFKNTKNVLEIPFFKK